MNVKYTIELLDTKKHSNKDFTCGEKQLDLYLRERATQERRKSITAVYVLREKISSIIIGYYTLSSFSISLTELPEDIIRKLPRYHALPTILIGRLAIDIQYQHEGLGGHLLLDALVRAYHLSKQIGTFAVIVDAKSEKAKGFYERHGFIQTKTSPIKLYVSMETVEKLIHFLSFP